MTNHQNPYNQSPQMGQPMIPPQPMPPRGQWQRRAMNAIGKAKSIMPNWLSSYPITLYIVALMVVSVMYSSYSMPWYYMLSGVVAVLVFFLYGSSVSKRISIQRIHRTKTFEIRVFGLAFVLRLIWVLLIYYIFMQNYGNAFGYENADADYYDSLGQFVAGLISEGNFHFYDEIARWSGHDDIADMGYGIYVGFIYWIVGSTGVIKASGMGGTAIGIVTVRLLKCLWSALTAVLIYRLTKRSFGDQTARVAAIFCALWPNFWYYCGAHLKETEMVFLGVLFVEQADQMLRSRKFTSWKLMPVLLIAAAIFTFRTPLGLVALLALIFSVVMSSHKVVSWGKRIIVGVLALLLIGVTVGNRIEEQSRSLLEQVQSGQQQTNMEWRSTRRDASGNTQSFAKYAGAAVFAPMIFTLPFPSMVRPFEGQDVQQLLNGGNFVKNIMSCFTILALIMLLMSGRWREHLLPLSFMLGYVVVLAVSTFAQSERFHQPAMPFEFMFAAYGLSIAVTKPKYKRWFTYWCVVMFVACIAWNWFKLKGRGL